MRHLHGFRRGAKAWLDIIGYLPGCLGADRQRGQSAVAANDGCQPLRRLNAAKIRVSQCRCVTVAVCVYKARRHSHSSRVKNLIGLGVQFRGNGLDCIVLYQHIGSKARRAGTIIDHAIPDECSHTSIPLAATFSLCRVFPS